MYKKIITSSLFLLMLINSIAQSRYNLIYEKQEGMNMAAENFATGFYLFDNLDSLLVKKNIINKEYKLAPFVNPVYRFSKLFLTNYVLTYYMMNMNHERFGHGYRALEAGGEIIEFINNPPPPFSFDFPYISLSQDNNMTAQQDIAITLAGSEANLVFADVLRKNILLDEQFSYNYTLAYLYASNDAPGYAAFVTSWGDPYDYRQSLNNFYNSSALTLSKVRAYSLIALLTDPINFFAYKSLFYNYLILGEHSSKIGMIKLSNNIKYLPRYRFENTPYGIELVLQNYFKVDQKLFQLNFSHSDGSFEPSWRIAANAWNLKKNANCSFNLSAQIWQQPSIEYFKDKALFRSEGLGGQIITTINYDFISNYHTMGATLHLGYKTMGYALGEQLDNGLIIRGGLTFKLR